MMIRKLDNLKLTIGDRFFKAFYITDDDDFAYDLSVFDDIRMDIREGISYESALIHSLVLNSGITIQGDNHNIMHMEIDSSITADFPSGFKYYDIRFTENDQVSTLLEGIIEIRKNISY